MKYEVILRLEQDDANDQWGLIPQGTADAGFNAFWNADGIFHDVFEHYFEDTHKYFKGQYAFQLYGEMCASGHAIAYRNIGINSFKYREGAFRDFTADTRFQLEEYFRQDILDYPIENCKVPYCDTDNNTVNYWLNSYYGEVEETLSHRERKWPPKLKTAIRNCYVYGYNTAKRMIGKDRDHVYDVLDEFLTEWDGITKHEAQSLSIMDENAYPIHGFKFVVENQPKFSVTCTVLDQVRNEYSIKELINY